MGLVDENERRWKLQNTLYQLKEEARHIFHGAKENAERGDLPKYLLTEDQLSKLRDNHRQQDEILAQMDELWSAE